MTELVPIQIIAQVSRSEQPAVQLGAEFLARSLKAVRKGDAQQPMKLALADPSADAGQIPPAQIYILSMHIELERERSPLPEIIARWTDAIRKLQRHGAPIFLCTIFRHVGDRDRTGASTETLARIRDLNLAAVRLSHALGVLVIDIDRVLSYFGNRVVRADHSMNSPRAADAAGHAIATAILSASPDALIDPVDQENARTALGGLDALPRLLRQRDEQRRQWTRQNG